MNEELLEQLETWHEEDEYQEIVDAITEIPPEERDYTLISHLGRALNNLGRYDEALEQFETVAEEGQDDALWHYRVGVSRYYLEQYEEAREAFQAADRLEPEDEDTLEFLAWIKEKTAKKKESSPKQKPKLALVKPSAGAVDFADFWDDSEEALQEYVSDPATDEGIESVEESLVFKLPSFYTSMMKVHNGGVPKRNSYPTADGETVTIAGFRAIGRDKATSLCGENGSLYVIEEGRYPEIGVVIADAPDWKQAVVMLDYRSAGNDGEPEVVLVERDKKYRITTLAPNVETFIRGLV